jgi:hypothetical protein
MLSELKSNKGDRDVEILTVGPTGAIELSNNVR